MNIKVDGSSTCGSYTYPSIDGKKVFSYTDMYVPVGHDRHARHRLERRPALVVDPGARRQDGRAPGLHEQDAGSRSPSRASGAASAPSCAAATTPTCTRASSRCRSTEWKAWYDRQADDIKAAEEAAAAGPQGARAGRRAAPQSARRRQRQHRRDPSRTRPAWPQSTTRPPQPPRARRSSRHAVRPEPTGWTSWITTTDHKRIGILYLWTVAVFFVLGGVEALLIRAAARRAGEHAALARALQPALHHARHDDGLPRRRARCGRASRTTCCR